MKSNRFRIKFLFPALALAAFLAAPSWAEGLHYRSGTVGVVSLQTSYTTKTKEVDGVTVYVEGTPMVYMTLVANDGTYTYHFPYSGDKAKGWLEILTKAQATGQKLYFYASDSYITSGRTACNNYSDEGCIELGGTTKYKMLQYLTIPAP